MKPSISQEFYTFLSTPYANPFSSEYDITHLTVTSLTKNEKEIITFINYCHTETIRLIETSFPAASLYFANSISSAVIINEGNICFLSSGSATKVFILAAQ